MRVSLGAARGEELAAVLVGDDGDVVGANPPGLVDDLLLVHPHERPQHRHARGSCDDGHVVQGLRRHLSDRLAGDQGARARVAGDALGDAQHHAPVDHHAQRRRHGQHDLALQLAEGHEVQARPHLVARQHLRHLTDFLLRRPRQERVAVEVHQHHRAAPLHQPQGGDGRIDAAREQSRHAPADAGRQAAGTLHLVEMVEGRILQELDTDRERPAVEIHLPAARLLDAPAEFPLDLRRRHRQVLHRAAHADAEAGGVDARQVGQQGVAHRGHVGRHVGRLREVGHAEDVQEAIADLRVVGLGLEHHLDAPHQRPHVAHAEIRSHPANVPHELADEVRPVAALEGDFLIVDDDGIHWPPLASSL